MPITFKDVTYYYGQGSPFESLAISHLNCTISDNKITAIVGETGSGKSTLIQMLNGIILPSEGSVVVNDFVIEKKMKNIKSLRKHVGIVFQFPEAQLFEETIEKDIIFGPMNFDVPLEEAKVIAAEMLQLVGLEESYLQKSPFDLSGGQKRRVAIAGILAMKPTVLILDEPTAGLDPQGAFLMMEMFKKLNDMYQTTIIIVTHEMDHVLNYCDEVILMSQGQVIKHEDTHTFFSDVTFLSDYNIELPLVLQLLNKLSSHDKKISPSSLTITDILKSLDGGRTHE